MPYYNADMFSEDNKRLGMCTVCPHCEHQFPTDRVFLRDIIKINEEMAIKDSDGDIRVPVLSRCPECGEPSWAHFRKEFLDNIKAGLINLEKQIEWLSTARDA